MNDIVKRLRSNRWAQLGANQDCHEAADHIEALEAEVARLRPLAEKWVMTLEIAYENSDGDEGYYDWQDALAALKGDT